VFWVGKTGQFDEERGWWFLWDDDCKTLFVSVKFKIFLLMFGAQGKV
jgi:hypothetical protein